MLQINAANRESIKEILQKSKDMSKKRKDIYVKYENMRKQVFKIKQIKLYKPVKGDAVDEMFAGYLNEAKLQIDVQRISAQNYMFGTKKILAKIINGKLVIRVGGGFMNAEEFIEQYGRIEMMKMLRNEEQKNQQTEIQSYQSQPNTGTSKQMSSQAKKIQMLMGQNMKEKMRQTLMNIRPYEQSSNGGSLGTSLQKSATN